MNRNAFLKIICFGALIMSVACIPASVEYEKPLVLLQEGDLPLFTDDLDHNSLQTAIVRSMQYYNRLPDERLLRCGERTCSVRDMKETLLEFAGILKTASSEESFQQKIGDTFDVFRCSGDKRSRVLFTGYYEPILKGSLIETAKYRYPLYRTPDDHIVIELREFNKKYKEERIIGRYEDADLKPYYTRREIDGEKCLHGRGLEIAWVADPVDLFFLHIQGSGAIVLPNDDIIKVSYAQSNGHPYRSIGKLLIDRDKIPREKISMKSIKEYLHEHPEEMHDILGHNQSYVFFRRVEEGPLGNLNVPITAGRSIATDSALFPKGALAFIKTRKPLIGSDESIYDWQHFSRFVLNQDTGGAIKGPGRVDLFCGRGVYAETMAGHLQEEGELYFLVKKKN